MDDLILGIDPGRSKVGWALAQEGGDLVASGIVALGDLEALLDGLFEGGDLSPRWLREEFSPGPWQREPKGVILGSGTGSDVVAGHLLRREIAFERVDEAFSTLRARDLYWRLHPPRGLLLLLPRGLRLPPRDLDDLAAWSLILAKGEARRR